MTMPGGQLVLRRLVVLSNCRKCAARRSGQFCDRSGEMTISRRLALQAGAVVERADPPVKPTVADG